ncbi:MAG: cytochrome c [Dehalococcoidales bacterium]
MKIRLLLFAAAVSVITFSWVLVTAVVAQEEPPFPYSGMENPFPWSDTLTQEVGKGLFEHYCLGCHGVDGGNIIGADFSSADFPENLEEEPDFYFWVLSEGRLDRGMPSYRSSLSDEQRWQALTYIWSLGAAVSPEAASPAPTHEHSGVVQLTAPEQAQSAQPMTLLAVIYDEEGKPVENALITYFIKVDFFANDLIKIGESTTGADGATALVYTPQMTGIVQIVALHQEEGQESHETTTTVNLIKNSEPHYQAEVGIRLPALGKPVFIGPESALEPSDGNAPKSAFYLPGGTVSWLLIVVITVLLIWFTYFRVMYQVFRMPFREETTDTDTRLVPIAGLVIVVLLGVLLVLMLVTGPYSHPHLLQ